jgi:hypothetical protein
MEEIAITHGVHLRHVGTHDWTDRWRHVDIS